MLDALAMVYGNYAAKPGLTGNVCFGQVATDGRQLQMYFPAWCRHH